MSKLEGGIFSRPRGKTGGIVFGAARTRRGKQVTTRLLVPPSNPKTPAQQQQRGKFSMALNLVKAWGPDAYQVPFNRTVSQLAGFQSLLSIILNHIQANGTMVNPTRETLLRGSNPLPKGIRYGGAGENFILWDDEPRSGGSVDDEVFAIGVEPYNLDGSGIATAVFKSGLTIADGDTGYDFPNPDQGAEVWVAMWTVGSGSNEGVFSNIRYGIDISD